MEAPERAVRQRPALGTDDHSPGGTSFGRLQILGKCASYPVGDPRTHRSDQEVLILGKRALLEANRFQFLATDLLQASAQANYLGRRRPKYHQLSKFSDFLLNDLLRIGLAWTLAPRIEGARLALSRAYIAAKFNGPLIAPRRHMARLDSPLQILKVVQKNSIKGTNRRIDIPGEREVNQDQFLASLIAFIAQDGQLLHVVRIKNELGRRSGADDKVGAGEVLRAVFDPSGYDTVRGRIEPEDQFARRILVVAQNAKRSGVSTRHLPGGALRHVSRTEDHDIPGTDRTENLFCEMHGGLRSRNEVGNESCFLTNSAPYSERFAQHSIEVTAGTSGVLGVLPCKGELSRNVALAYIHRVESAANPECVCQSLLIKQPIETIPFLELEIVFGGEKAEDRVHGERRVAPEDEFGPIRGGEYDYFLDALALREHRENFRLTATAHPEAFADFYAGASVI